MDKATTTDAVLQPASDPEPAESSKRRPVMSRVIAIAVSCGVLISVALAQGRGGQANRPAPPPSTQGENTPNGAPQAPAPPAVETASKTQHQITLGGKTIPYTATAGTLVLKKEDGKPWASMFYTSYTRDDVQDLG